MKDYQIEEKILRALRDLNLSSTVAELMVKTELPRNVIEETLPVIVQERRGQYQVKESGEIVYTFPKGLANIETGFGARFQRFLRWVTNVFLQTLVFLFKIWIVVMLVGYFIIFVAIALLFLLALLAASFSSKDNRESKTSNRAGSAVFSLAMNLIEFMIRLWFYSQLFGAPRNQEIKHQKTSPFHEAVFRFEFGTSDVVKPWEQEAKQRLIGYIKTNRGIVTLDEIQLFLGVNREEANRYLSYLLLNYKGDVRVSDSGGIYGWFPEILRTIRSAQIKDPPPSIPMQPFSGNSKGVQPWIITFNVVNFVFGVMFTAFFFEKGDNLSFLTILPYFFHSVLSGIIDSASAFSVSTVGLGFVPLSFSFLFFAVPLLRWIWLKSYNKKIQSRNQAISILRGIYQSPQKFEIKNNWEKRIIMDFADQRKIDVVSNRDRLYYSLPQLIKEKEDLIHLRSKVDPDHYALGETIFDSGT